MPDEPHIDPQGEMSTSQPGQADVIAERIARDIAEAATRSGQAAVAAAEDAQKHLRALVNPALMRYHGDDVPLGIRLANGVTGVMGSWRFIIIQTVLVILWVGLNIIGLVNRWDPYPFILLNLMFSVQAAYASPLILMAGNVAADRDRDLWEHDYQVNQEAYAKIESIELRTQEMLTSINQLIDQRMPARAADPTPERG
ncbi:MAG: hypothetical protein QOK05_1675 [Chloroflexota bacterium]|jgi:uncharacterized membrane protein|nr:hypothetical protein [Chloroflexota bacterium]